MFFDLKRALLSTVHRLSAHFLTPPPPCFCMQSQEHRLSKQGRCGVAMEVLGV